MANQQERRAFEIKYRPSQEVQQFLDENPHPNWKDSLTFTLSHWPQVTQKRINYLIEGGAAIKLLYPGRQEPDDLDIVTGSKSMENAFRNSRRFDVKHLSHWYSNRRYPYNPLSFPPAPGRFILDMNELVSFNGINVLILNRLALAVAKTLRYGNQSPREKDLKDLELLNQDPSEIEEVIVKMKNAYPNSNRT